MEGEIGGAAKPGEGGEREGGGVWADNFGDTREQVLGGKNSVRAKKARELGQEGEKSEEVAEACDAGEEPKAEGVVHGRDAE